MFSLAPLGNIARFRSKSFTNEVYLITNGDRVKANGVLLAARSAVIEEILVSSENIPAAEFTDDVAGLRTCLMLLYGGSVNIGEDNFKSIYNFGRLFQIREMVEGVLTWVAKDVSYSKFWNMYFDLKRLDEDTLIFVEVAKRHLCNNSDGFLQSAKDLPQCRNDKNLADVMDLLSRMEDKRLLSAIVHLVGTATANNEVPSVSILSNNHLQEAVSSAVNYIENYLISDQCVTSDKACCIKTLKKVYRICSNEVTLGTIRTLLAHEGSRCISEIAVTDLNWETVRLLTSPTTSYDTIRNFVEKAGTEIHPCVVAEIVLKWWSVRENADNNLSMGFITPLITAINNISTYWFPSVYHDEKYGDLLTALAVPEPTAVSYLFYDYSDIDNDNNKKCIPYDCIAKGDGTPAQLMHVQSSDDMERHRKNIFRYNAGVFPAYMDVKHHWFIRMGNPDKHVSLITGSQEDILADIRNAEWLELHFVQYP